MISVRRITAWRPVLVFAVVLVAAPQGVCRRTTVEVRRSWRRM
jgi:hypothetical protein